MKKVFVAVFLAGFAFQSISIALPKDFFFDRAKKKVEAKVKVKKGVEHKHKHEHKPAFFSHKQHVKKQKLKCKNCHNKAMFRKKKRNSAKFNMKDIYKGKFCGKCHKKKPGKKDKAFSIKKCKNCHVKANKTKKAKKKVKKKQ